jgi:hypothetical protein
MIRAQIQFPEEQHRQLKRWAQQRSISVAEAVRRCVAERLATERSAPSRAMLVREALGVAGKYVDAKGARNLGRDHDAYLADAYRR